jgi:hypothetical protein
MNLQPATLTEPIEIDQLFAVACFHPVNKATLPQGVPSPINPAFGTPAGTPLPTPTSDAMKRPDTPVPDSVKPVSPVQGVNPVATCRTRVFNAQLNTDLFEITSLSNPSTASNALQGSGSLFTAKTTDASFYAMMKITFKTTYLPTIYNVHFDATNVKEAGYIIQANNKMSLQAKNKPVVDMVAKVDDELHPQVYGNVIYLVAKPAGADLTLQFSNVYIQACV